MRFFQRRSGNLLIIIVVAALLAIVLGALLTKTQRDSYSVQDDIEATLDIENDATLANVILDRFLDDLNNAYYEKGYAFGMVSPDYAMYCEMLANINERYFEEKNPGEYHYIGYDATKIFETITFRNSTAGTMESKLNKFVQKIGTYDLALTTPWMQFDAIPVGFSYEDGGDLMLQDICLTLTFRDGIRVCRMTYRLEDLKAVYTITPGQVHCAISTEDAELILLTQTYG